jgi:competence protein ComEA
VAHRSVSPPDSDIDPFWHDALQHRPPLLERVTALAHPLRSWVVAAAGVLAVAGAGWWLLRPGAPPIESALPAAEASTPAPGTAGPSAGGSDAAATTSTTAADLVVQAAGAVARPGVYELPPGARVDDLVKASGGLTGQADVDRVNLAAPVADGERVWVPAKGQEQVPDVVAGAGGGSASPVAGNGSAAADGPSGGSALPATPVDLNTATAEELDVLPGVGPATATAILAYRDEHGRFGSVDELLEVRGIGEAKLEELRSLVRV